MKETANAIEGLREVVEKTLKNLVQFKMRDMDGVKTSLDRLHREMTNT